MEQHNSFRFFEDLNSRQKSIYADACCIGVLVLEDAFRDSVRDNLREVMGECGYRQQVWGDARQSHGSTTSCFVPFEKADDERDRGVVFELTHNVDAERNLEFFSVDFRVDTLGVEKKSYYRAGRVK